MKKDESGYETRINYDAPVLYDAESGEPMRNASKDETIRSQEAKQPGADRGIIEVDGKRCYVADWAQTRGGPDRRVSGPST